MAFFSGTDTNTLTTEGSERTNFLSLIVNNAQKYCAKYTQKVVRDYDISYIDKVFIKDTFFKRKKVSSKNQITVVESWNLACVIPMQDDVDTMRKMQEEKSKPSYSFKGGQLSMFDGYDWGRNTAGNWSSTASNDHVMTSKSVEEIENDELEQFCKFIACGDCFAEESIEECLEKTEARIKKNPSFKDEYEWMVGDIIMDSLGYGLTPDMLGFDIKDAIKTLEKHKDKHPDLVNFLIESLKAYDYEFGTTK